MPTSLIEFSPRPSNPQSWGRAKDKGWIDPLSVPEGHSGFASRAVWGDNPVQELALRSTGIPRVVALLADAADNQLFSPRRRSLTIKIFCNRAKDTDDETAHAAAPLPAPIGIR
jgi:hypothetical protein